jgi:hypothetical protein
LKHRLSPKALGGLLQIGRRNPRWPKDVMDKIEEYRARAAYCLSLARKSSSHDEKKQLESMAEIWCVLADYREAALERK